MTKVTIKTAQERRKTKIRAQIKSSGRGRKLVVYRSLKHIFGQVIDLPTGKTMLTVGDWNLAKNKKLKKIEKAFETGKMLAEKALTLSVKNIVFDRGGYLYHGRVKAFADGARAGGLNF